MKPRFRRLAYAGAATVGAAVTAFVLAGGPSATADQCVGAQRANAVTEPLAAECATAVQAAGAASEGRPGARVAAATPNEASPPGDDEGSAGNPVQPGTSGGPVVPETPEANPVEPEASTPPEVPETTPPAGETPSTPQAQQPSEAPTPEESAPQPQVPGGGATNQPELPVTGRDDAPLLAGLGAGLLAAGAATVAATRRRRSH